METTYYTFNAREIVVSGDGVQQVSGGTRRLVCLRESAPRAGENGADEAPRGKVIDLAAWRADREEEQRLEELWFAGVDEALEHPVAAAPRQRKVHERSVLLGSEMLATLSVVGVMAVLILRVLVG